jgi:flagellar biosynthesis regulator FlaF
MAYGSQTYRNSEAGALAPREIEAAAFVFVNRALEGADDNRAKVEALCKNQKLWSLLLKDLACSANTLPDILKQDLVRLGTWSVAYSIRAMPGSLTLQPLIDINRDMAEALRGAEHAAPAPAPRMAASLMAAV